MVSCPLLRNHGTTIVLPDDAVCGKALGAAQQQLKHKQIHLFNATINNNNELQFDKHDNCHCSDNVIVIELNVIE